MCIEWREGGKKPTYRDEEGRGGESEACNFGGVNTFVSQVLEIRVKRASDLG